MDSSPASCPLSAAQIQTSLDALESGVNLDPPYQEQQCLARNNKRDELIELHLWLLVGIALQYTKASEGQRESLDPSKQLEFDKALQERITAGYPGLVQARKKWDPERGYKFGTYASWWIRQAISKSQQVPSREELP